MSKLSKSKQPDLENFTSLELAYLVMDLAQEITGREKAVDKLMDELNQKTFDYTHEIELGTHKTRKDKADFYEEMEDHFENRRKAKQEQIVIDDVIRPLDINAHKVVSKIGHLINKKQRYFQVEDGESLSGRGWKEFYDNYMKPYT